MSTMHGNLALLRKKKGSIMIITQRIQELRALGFYVENMAIEYGPGFIGEFRWMNDQTGDFQDSGTSDSEQDAWADCAEFALSLEA
jgi:hypothetical protein